MSTRPDKLQPEYSAPPITAAQRSLLWELQRALRTIEVSDGAFRAITGRWPVQLSEAELRTWVDWFTTPTDVGAVLPPMPLGRASSGGSSEESRESPAAEDDEERRREPGGERPAMARGMPPAARPGSNASQQERRPQRGPQPQAAPQPPQAAPQPPQAAPQPPQAAPQPPQAAPQPQQRPQPQQAAPPPQPPTARTPEPAGEAEPAEAEELTAEERLFIQAIRNGVQVREAAQRAGLSVSTLYQRRARKPTFAEAWRSALSNRESYDGAEANE